MIDALPDGLAVCRACAKRNQKCLSFNWKLPTFRHMLLTITAAYAHAIDNVSLFCFVAKPPSLVRARRARSPVDDIQLAVLPTAVPHPRSGNVQ
jgi:hypothetical protein